MKNVLKMPLWGPYSKKYMGITRVVDTAAKSGGRFDFIVHPTLWNSSVPVPNVTVPSNYHLWRCNDDYSFYSYRYELEWKDRVYADISFSKINDEAYLVRTEFHNNTELSHQCVLNYFSALEYPEPFYCDVTFPEKYDVLGAEKYTEYTYSRPRPWDNENPDAMEKGTFIDPTFYEGKGIGDRVDNAHVHFLNLLPFGADKGDKVAFKIDKQNSYSNPVLAVRYKTVTDGDAEFDVNGNKVNFESSKELTIKYIETSDSEFEFVSLGKAGIEFDFFAIVEKGTDITAEIKRFDVKPQMTVKDSKYGKQVSLEYGEVGKKFCVTTNNKKTRERELPSGSLEDALINRLSNGDITFDELQRTFSESFKEKTSDEGYFQNTLIHSIFIDAGKTHTEYAVISQNDFDSLSNEEYEKIYNERKAESSLCQFNEAGKPFEFSTSRLKATLFTNIVYPVYRHGKYVIHHTPGKRWDCFYTWDSGFIGLGMLEFSPKLAEYILDTYLSEPENKDFAFLHHGSPVPTQFYLYLELLKRENNKEKLLEHYEMAKRYYDFMAGNTEGSTTRKFGNGLTTTYDYFYSTSGMDDYPPQHAMIDQKMEKYCCPVISTSQAIRIGKIMKMVALALHKNDDAEAYQKDIDGFTDALTKVAWDDESGYFSYTVYDDDKNKVGFFRTEDGENLNKGMDGIYPIIAGACNDNEKKKVLAHIMSDKEMKSPVGISAVDMSAGYYGDNGYWNGNVWMSHQWFIWKTMFDLGETDFAFWIADTALNTWKVETDYSYNTYECFNIATKRGGWFHNFGGLSAPVCIWANAYYKPGTITTGLDTWVDKESADENGAVLKYKYYGNNDKYSVVICLSDKNEYSVTLNGKLIEFNERVKGAIELTISGDIKEGFVEVTKK